MSMKDFKGTQVYPETKITVKQTQICACLLFLHFMCARETEKGTEGWRDREGGGVYVESLTVAQAAEGRGASPSATPTHFGYYFKFEV